MKTIYFNPLDMKSVVLKFTCTGCKYDIETDEINVPMPDYSADTVAESWNNNDDCVLCEKCEKEFNISISSTYGDGYVEIEELEDTDDVDLEEILSVDEDHLDTLDAILNNTEFYNNFKQSITDLYYLNNKEFESYMPEKTLRQQLFIGVITCMETYLSDAFINTTLNNKDYLENFVKSFPKFNDMKFPLKMIFHFQEEIKKIAEKAMLDVIYHNLGKVKKMYENTFHIKFPAIKELRRDISMRHDLVHRNGKDKNGTEINVSKELVNKTITGIEKFILEIDDQMGEKNVIITN